jgi:hypothetical protein
MVLSVVFAGLISRRLEMPAQRGVTNAACLSRLSVGLGEMPGSLAGGSIHADT